MVKSRHPEISGSKENKQTVPKATEVLHALGRAFWKLADHYQLTQKEIAILLGIKAENRQRLNHLKQKQEIPDDPDKRLRVSHLIGIHKNLRILFPQNRDVVYSWLKTRRELFEGKSAMEFIAEDPMQSLPRMFSVRRLLDQIRVSG